MPLAPWMLLIALSLSATPLWSQPYSLLLQDGRAILLNPATNQARFADEPGRLLWDGVHRLYDGSVMIVRDGVVISHGGQPTTPILDDPSPSEAQTDISPCVRLAISSCGFNGECRDAPACLSARQLIDMEMDETLRKLEAQGPSTTEQCRTALTDTQWFQPCILPPPADENTPCAQLVSHVCGIDNRCSGSEACQAAGQLKAMEQRERMEARRRGRLTHSSQQCLEAVKRGGFFSQCGAPGNDP